MKLTQPLIDAGGERRFDLRGGAVTAYLCPQKSPDKPWSRYEMCEITLPANPENKRRLSLPARFLLMAQKIYKLTLSPLIGGQCRYLPTCSQYAADCVEMHGAWRGSWMGFARVCRCNPLGGSGYDPAPTNATDAKWFEPWKYGDWDKRHRAPKVSEEDENDRP